MVKRVNLLTYKFDTKLTQCNAFAESRFNKSKFKLLEMTFLY